MSLEILLPFNLLDLPRYLSSIGCDNGHIEFIGNPTQPHLIRDLICNF